MQIRLNEAGSLVRTNNNIRLDDRVVVEWKHSDNQDTRRNVSVNIGVEDETPVYRIKIGKQREWTRLYIDPPPASGPVLGLRILIKILGPATRHRLKPFLAQTNQRRGSRSEISGSPAVQLQVISGSWYEISGAYLCGSPTPGNKIGIVLDLPREAEVLLAHVDVEWLSGDTTDGVAGTLDEKIALPIRSFGARPVANVVNWIQQPPVYALSAAAEEGRLRGWALTSRQQLFMAVDDPSGAQPFVLDQGLVLSPGAALTCAFDIQIPSCFKQSEHLFLLASAGSVEPLWVGSTSAGSVSVIVEHVRLLEAHVSDFMLNLHGVALNPHYPGMPVRLAIFLDEQKVADLIAVAPDKDNLLSPVIPAFRFSATVPVPERMLRAALSIRIQDAADTNLPHYFPFTVTSSVSAQKLPEPEGVVAIPSDASVIGNVEAITEREITGWAMCPAAPDAQVELVLLMDGQPCVYSKTTRYRKDVQTIHGGKGFYGFIFELPPNLAALATSHFEVQAINGVSKIKRNLFQKALPSGQIERASLPAPRRFDPSIHVGGAGQIANRISLIILNRNGAALLQEMFGSCDPADMMNEIEWIVVDHNSEDNSEAVCRSFADRGAEVQFLRRRGNYSFSESNNFGARHAKGDILIFANNDLLFCHGFAARVRAYMADPVIGLLGVRLLDHIDDANRQDLKIVQHLGVFFDTALNKSDWIRPYEARAGFETTMTETATRAVAVTGAFFAMRKDEFCAIDGFDEAYSYGLEDVDLCLKVQARLGKTVVCANDIEIIHHRGFSRQKDNDSALRRRRNNEVFNARWGNYIRRQIKETCLSDPAVWTGSRPVLAFIVPDVGDTTPMGDFHTALEMGRALQRLMPCHVRHLPESVWYDLTGVDVVVAMVNRFDITKVQNASPWLITVNWMRQWFDRWANDPTVHYYDHLFASSATAARYLEERLGRKVGVMPIASSAETFAQGTRDEELASDYCFTGSRFGPPREIEFQLDPKAIHGKGRVFGHNWEGTPFEALSAGPVAYSRMPDVYASTRIVLDDANIATKPWGSCNSRIFDALAAGTLLVTNGALGANELFGDLVPTFDSAASLTATLNYWLTHEDERLARVARLQDLVRREHTYDNRARQLRDALLDMPRPVRIAIKCAATFAKRHQWGDYHYAESLATSLRKLGHVVRVDCREAWTSDISHSDDVVIVLRGLIRYQARSHQYNILWLISHPDNVSNDELKSYDHVCVASERHAEILTELLQKLVEFMPQCTDTTRFRYRPDLVNTHPDRRLYVANSRGIFRDPVNWAIQHELPIDIYGVGWEPFINDSRRKGELVPNQILGELYASSRLVICDHWADMRDLGYISNRVFDVLATGGRLLVDPVAGLESLVPAEYYDLFHDEEEFVARINGETPFDPDLRRAAAEWVKDHHSFDARARVFSARIAALLNHQGQAA